MYLILIIVHTLSVYFPTETNRLLIVSSLIVQINFYMHNCAL